MLNQGSINQNLRHKGDRMKLYGRQGDVGFVAGKIPKDAKLIKVRPFALGEVTGHSHRVAVEDEAGVEMYEHAGATFLRVTKDRLICILHQHPYPHCKVSVLAAGWEGEVSIAWEYNEEVDI